MNSYADFSKVFMHFIQGRRIFNAGECHLYPGVSSPVSLGGSVLLAVSPSRGWGLRFLENGVGGLERLHPPLCLQGWGGPSSPWHRASQEEAAQRDFLGFSRAKPSLFPALGSALEAF